MLDEFEAIVAAAEAFSSSSAARDRDRLLAIIRDQLRKLASADERAKAELLKFDRGAEVNAEARRAIDATVAEESRITEKLLGHIRNLQGYLNGTFHLDDPAAHQLLQEAIDVASGYLAGYQQLRTWMIRISAEGQANEQADRRRRVSGEIDHAALTQEIIARFPKILAALAK